MTPPSAAAVAARTAPAVHPRRAPLAPVRRPRRVSGPAARPARARPAPRARTAASTAGALVTHPLLDRLIHGRAWIGIVAFALIGIVTMQLGLLKLNAGIGRALEHEAALQRENSALSVENSEVAAGDTVELQAAHMGMQLIPAGALRFLSARARAGDLARAVSTARTPASAVSSTSSPASTGTPESTATASGIESATATTPSSASTASGEASIQSTSAATPASQSTSSTEPRTPAATSTAPAQTTEGASAPSPAPVSTGESGGASASPQG